MKLEGPLDFRLPNFDFRSAIQNPKWDKGAGMYLRFLGTSAGELYPGLWCRCRNCDTARRGTDRDRRQSAALAILEAPASESPERSQAVPRALIDFPSEIAAQAQRHRIDLAQLEHMLVTHSHGDHWFPYLLRWRSMPREYCQA